MVNSEDLIGTTEYLTLQARCCINRCRYNRVRLYVNSLFMSVCKVEFLTLQYSQDKVSRNY
jgi:hypothetical protein